MTMKLYCFGESGNSYKAALTLQLAGVDWEPVPVDFFAGETRSPLYRATVNEMGEAPVLVDGDLHLSQSGVIQHYIAEKTAKLAGQPEDRLEILRWQFWDNHKLSSQAGTCRFLINFLPEEKREHQKTVIAFLQGRLDAAYWWKTGWERKMKLMPTVRSMTTIASAIYANIFAPWQTRLKMACR